MAIEVRTRAVVVNGHTFAVPTHVSRVDSTGWAGWQVRFPNQAGVFFSDAKPKTEQASFAAAVKYANKHRPKPTSKAVLRGTGLRWTWKKNVSGVECLYVEVSGMTNKIAAKRVYVGTRNTVNEERKAKAWSAATAIRDKLRTAHQQQINKRHANSLKALR